MISHRATLLSGLKINTGNQMKFYIAGYVAKNTKAIPVLWDILKSEPEPYNVRAMWAFELLCLNDETIFEEYLDKIANFFIISQNTSINRMLSKLLMLKNVSCKNEGGVLNSAFERLCNKTMPIALRVNCMQIIFNLSQKYPELGIELRGIIESEIETCKPAFKSRAKKILKQMKISNKTIGI